ncbi:MAG: NADH-ubiquinone oxidoreductase subunit NDUFA12 family protein [Alphaproteobacteria bacterium]
MSLSTKLFTLLYGKKKGEDDYGNKYYYATPRKHWWQVTQCKPGKWGREKRWVVYGKDFLKFGVEASAVPAEWNIWLHHIASEPLDTKDKHSWEQKAMANPTGTKDAILPKGLQQGGKAQKSSQEFDAWVPDA